ncbi:MAG: DNA repair protein RecO [bacterium]|nr:DNA repair protein RecO [bacterium]
MAQLYTTNAININSYNLSENDKIIVMYSKDNGIIRCVAKGVKKPKSKLGGRMDLLINNNLVLSKGKNLDVVSQAEVINGFKNIRLDFTRLGLAIYCAELVGIFGVENDPNSEHIYKLMLDTLDKIDKTSGKSNLLPIVFDFQLELMDITGYKLALDNCSCCGKPYKSGDFRFSISSGGVICNHCAGFNSMSAEKTEQIIKVLKKHSGEENLSMQEFCFDTMKDYISYHSGRKIKTHAFLNII